MITWDTSQFFQSYLTGFVFWIQISLGCLGLLMTHHLTGGYWGISVRRFFEAGTKTFWLMALLFLPILLGLKFLYPWARQDEVALSALLQHQSKYLNSSFFALRAIVYFSVWIGLGVFLTRPSRNEASFYRISGPGLVLFCFTAAFASYDWIMSLQNDWYSSVFGMIFFTSSGLGAIAFVILYVVFFTKMNDFSKVYPAQCLNDLGNILLVFIMVWAYLNFSQFLIIWEGNKPVEVEWFFKRTREGWQWLSYLLIMFQFALPFFLLLFRGTKRKALSIGFVAMLTFLIRIVDVYWSIAPNFHIELRIHLLDVLIPVSIGMLWVTLFVS